VPLGEVSPHFAPACSSSSCSELARPDFDSRPKVALLDFAAQSLPPLILRPASRSCSCVQKLLGGAGLPSASSIWRGLASCTGSAQ
jgi:hypothetical protein